MSKAESSKQQHLTVVYEYPLREQVRSFLRLESLFRQFERNQIAIHPDNHWHALKLLFEILEILERGDTRSELIKELARLSELFTALRQNPQVDGSKLENFLNQIERLHAWVLNYDGKFGEKLRKQPFIETVKQRSSIPGGTCQFDCPDLYLFLKQPHQQRQLQLKNWLADIEGVKTSIEVILRIMRDNGEWKEQNAPMGSFLLDTSESNFQLLRLRLAEDSDFFPEFSCGKHRSNIHFMRFNQHHKKIAIQYAVEFELACCH